MDKQKKFFFTDNVYSLSIFHNKEDYENDLFHC